MKEIVEEYGEYAAAFLVGTGILLGCRRIAGVFMIAAERFLEKLC